MSPDLLAAAHAALDAQRDEIEASRGEARRATDAADDELVQRCERSVGDPGPLSPRGGEWSDGSLHSDKLKGYPRMDIGELMTLPLPHCLPFREMAAHPAIIQRLNWMMGPAFKLGTLGYSIVSERGCGGQELHANGHPMLGPLNLMELYDGRLHSGHVNVGFQLHDVEHERDGGFVIIPGSREAHATAVASLRRPPPEAEPSAEFCRCWLAQTKPITVSRHQTRVTRVW
jgi:hypothetical protein